MVWFGIPNLGMTFLHNELSLKRTSSHTPLKFVIEKFDCIYGADIRYEQSIIANICYKQSNIANIRYKQSLLYDS